MKTCLRKRSTHNRTNTCGSVTCARNSGWRVRLWRDVVGADLRAARREPGCQPATGRLGDPALPTPQSATRWRSALSTTSSWRERVFESMIAFYGRTLQFVFKHQGFTLSVAEATLIFTVYLYIIIPRPHRESVA